MGYRIDLNNPNVTTTMDKGTKEKKWYFISLPFDLDVLSATVRDALFQFISAGGASFKYEQVRLLANAAIGEHLVTSTNGSSIDRKAFEEDLRARIKLLSSNSQDSRTPICICSKVTRLKRFISVIIWK